MRAIITPTCNCECHKKGSIVFCDSCCRWSGIKYIEKDGTIDLINFNNIIRINAPFPRIDGGEYIRRRK